MHSKDRTWVITLVKSCYDLVITAESDETINEDVCSERIPDAW